MAKKVKSNDSKEFTKGAQKPVNSLGFDIKQLDKIEVCKTFRFKALDLIRVTYAGASVVYLTCEINDCPCVLSDSRTEFIQFLSQFVNQ